MSYKCEIVADSINSNNNRLTTFLITYPRIIHSELMTHRVFSRNSASSRAIPFEKMVKMVEDDPFIPIAWQKEHKGMQGSEYWIDDDTVTVDEGDEYERYTKIYSATEHFITEWLEARDLAIAQSYELNRLGVTKQLCNRLLEPFMWHTVLVTGTEFENFFSLRCPKYTFGKLRVWRSRKDAIIDFPDWESRNDLFWLSINKSQAEIHIQKIAEMMFDCYNESTPKQLKAGEWHIPFGNDINMVSLGGAIANLNRYASTSEINIHKYILNVATARCARLSYQTLGDNPKIDYEADIKLHDRLLESKHLSCFEHCARAMSDEEYYSFLKGELKTKIVNSFNERRTNAIDKNSSVFGWCNNFRGFTSYRYLIDNNLKM